MNKPNETTEDKLRRLEEESKLEHRKDVEDRVSIYRVNFYKWRIFMALLSLCVPKLYLKLYKKRAEVRRRVRYVLIHYIPLIQDQMQLKLYFFNLWETENSGPNLCASRSTISNGNDINNLLEELVPDMMKELYNINEYDTWFHHIEDPRCLIENPYPGYMDIRRACNYCDELLAVFW